MLGGSVQVLLGLGQPLMGLNEELLALLERVLRPLQQARDAGLALVDQRRSALLHGCLGTQGVSLA